MNHLKVNHTNLARFCKGGLLVLLLVAIGGQAHAQTGGTSYDLSWNTVDGGGGHSAGGRYTLDGTIGQPDAGVLAEAGAPNGYVLSGGFWTGGEIPVPPQYHIYLPLITRS